MFPSIMLLLLCLSPYSAILTPSRYNNVNTITVVVKYDNIQLHIIAMAYSSHLLSK